MKKISDKKSKKNTEKVKKNKKKPSHESNEMLPNDDPKKATEMETDEPILNMKDYEERYLDNYAKEKNENEKYAKKRSRDEYYKKDETEMIEVFAKRKRGGKMVDYYAKTQKKVDMFARQKIGEEWVEREYIKDEHENQIYPYNPEEKKYYCKYNKAGEPVFALDKDGNEYYPSKLDPTTNVFIQYIPKKTNGDLFCIITEEGKQKYPEIESTKVPVYPKDDDRNEFYLKDDKQQPYYLEYLGNQSYAINKNREEVVAVINGKQTYAKINNGKKQIYPYNHLVHRCYTLFTEEGDPILTEDEHNKKYYPHYQDSKTKHIIEYVPFTKGTDIKRSEPFPIVENKRQIYPMNLTKNVPVYPHVYFGNEFYLLNENGEPYYIEIDGTEKYANDKDGKNIFMERDGVEVYARANDKVTNKRKEIYPRFGTDKSQYYKRVGDEDVPALSDVDGTIGYYAKDEDQNEIYPKKYFRFENTTPDTVEMETSDDSNKKEEKNNFPEVTERDTEEDRTSEEEPDLSEDEGKNEFPLDAVDGVDDVEPMEH